MSKDYIGKKKKSGVAGLIFFCLIAFVLTFVISYSVNSYRRAQTELSLKKEGEKSRLSQELDALFEDGDISVLDEEEKPRKDVNIEEKPKAEVQEKNVQENTKPTAFETEQIGSSETENTETVEVSTSPEKAIIPIADGKILKGFSTSPEYSDFFEDWRTHSGVDISGKAGVDVRAIADGTVVEAYIDPICGGTMKIDHGAFYSVYQGLDPENMEMNGTVVKRGDVVAKLQGNILGESSQPHLHFEIIENNVYTDPIKYIG